MRLRVFGVLAAGIPLSLVSTVTSAPCPASTVTLTVSTPTELENLIDSVSCAGKGVFEISWRGILPLQQRIDVFDSKKLTIIGIESLSASSNDDTYNILGIDSRSTSSNDRSDDLQHGVFDAGKATGTSSNDDITYDHLQYGGIDAGNTTGIFSVSNGSTLRLSNMVLEGGYAEDGGGVQVDSSSSVYAYGCAFVNNSASTGGAIHATSSEIHIDEKTYFAYNSAKKGGAIHGLDSNITIGANTVFTHNFASLLGGAVEANSSEVYINGNTTFKHNEADLHGGGVFALSSTVSISGGSTHFFNNTGGGFGGALHAYESVFYMEGSTSFNNNSVEASGGAMHAIRSDVYFNGNTAFSSNSAEESGGAVDSSGSTVVFSGNTTFSDNSAQWYGGIMYAYDTHNVQIEGNMRFAYNSGETCVLGHTIETYGSSVSVDDCYSAMYADNTSEVQVEGNTRFAHNSADYGGAIAGYYSDIVVEGGEACKGDTPDGEGPPCSKTDNKTTSGGSVEFIENTAVSRGAIWSLGADVLNISGAIFQSNEAESGGAIFVGSTDGIETEFSGCAFEGNEATDGGALYLYTGAGVDVFTKCIFRNNYATYSGGGIFHTGFMRLAHTSFEANRAGSDGAAVMSIGILKQLSDVVFSENTYECAIGEYGYIIEAETGFCSTCFDEVCARCSTGSNDIVHNKEVEIDGLPVCVEVPSGATASSKGTTVETLSLEEGYYRTSNTSHVMLECYQEEACLGGIAVGDNSCASGYEGPYCAVCAEGHAPGASYSCHECSDESIQSAVGIMVVVISAILLVAALLISYMWSVVREERGGEEKEEEERRGGSWRQKFRYCRVMVVRMVPVTAIKIVITVWQIVYQFNAIAGNVYPELYQNFVSELSPINVDIGFSITYSCVVVTNFYDRLILATVVPPLMLLVLAGSYVIGKVLYRRSRYLEIRAVLNRSISGLEVSAISNRRRGSYDLELSAVRQKHQQAALFVLFLVYSSVSYTIFQTFVCDDLDNGISYVRADYNLTCSTTQHAAYKTYAMMMVFIYPVGIPAMYVWLLARNRRDLINPEREKMAHLEPLRGIWAAYRPSRYFFEVVECGRRIALTGIAAFVHPNSTVQVAIVLLVATLFVFLSESLAPFVRKADMNLYRWGNGIIVASLYAAFLLKVNLGHDTEEALVAFSGVLIAANVFMVLTTLVQTGLLVRECRAELKDGRLVDARTAASDESPACMDWPSERGVG